MVTRLQRETKKERLRRALAQQRLGMAVPDDSDLFRVRGSPGGAEPSSSGEESDEGKPASTRVSMPPNPAGGASAAAKKRKRAPKRTGRDAESDNSDEHGGNNADEAMEDEEAGEGQEGEELGVTEAR